MAHNFQRPSLPYENESLQNDKRYQLLTRSNKRPPTDQMLDTDVNYLIDAVRQLDEDIAGVSAGIIPGADNPDNANFFPTTDGDGNISWTDVSDTNVRDRSLSGSKLLLQTITALEIMDGTIPKSKMAPNSIGTSNLEDEAVKGSKVDERTLPGSKMILHTIGNDEMGDDAIDTNNVKDLAITGPKIVDGAVTLPKINAVFPVTMGGSGLTTLTTSNGVICAGTTPTGNFQNAGVGLLNQIFMGNGNAAVGSWKNLNTLAAVKANQIAANSTEVYTSPSVQQYHPSACKAWAQFNGLLGSPIAPSASYNITSITKTSGGKFIGNLTTPFTSINYSVGGSCGRPAASSLVYLVSPYGVENTTSSFNFVTIYQALSASGDTEVVSIQVFGTQ